MILIIDDDSAVRSSLSFMLKRAGYEAQVVPGPREAMEVVRSVAPDLFPNRGTTLPCCNVSRRPWNFPLLLKKQRRNRTTHSIVIISSVVAKA